MITVPKEVFKDQGKVTYFADINEPTSSEWSEL